MDVTERTLTIVFQLAFIGRIQERVRRADRIGYRLPKFPRVDIARTRQIWPWKVRPITSLCCSGVSRTKLTA
jgi:hypothetical protein